MPKELTASQMGKLGGVARKLALSKARRVEIATIASKAAAKARTKAAKEKKASKGA